MSANPSLRIAVFGASGHIGSVITAEAAARGHRVTAVARRALSLCDAVGVTAVSADVLDAQALTQAVAGHDAVVAALAGRDPGAANTVPEAARLFLAVLPEAGVNRLVFVGGGGSLHDPTGQRFVDDPHFPEQYKQEALAAAEALEIFRASESKLNWSYLSPPPMYLLDGDRTGVYRTQGGDQPLSDNAGESRITVGDLAAAVLDVVEDGSFSRQRFTAAY